MQIDYVHMSAVLLMLLKAHTLTPVKAVTYDFKFIIFCDQHAY